MMATSYPAIRPAVGYAPTSGDRSIRATLSSATDLKVSDIPNDEEADG